jgi:hypothetical protein
MTLHAATRTRGRAVVIPTVLSMRELEPTEVEEFLARERGTKANPLQRLSSRHRKLAHYIASGATVTEAAMAFGMTVSRVSLLKQDQTFQELITFYQNTTDEARQDLQEVLEGLSLDALTALIDRLEETPDEFSTGELMSLAKMTADRSGHAPTKKVEQNININVGARLDQARERARAKLIEHRQEEVSFHE